MSEPTTKPSAAAIGCAEELIKRKDLVDVPMNVPAAEIAEVIDAQIAPFREKAMKQIKWTDEDDTESWHARADALLCDLLTELGCGDVVDEFNKRDKWYA